MELEPYGKALAQRYVYSLEFYRRWPQMEAEIKQFAADAEKGIFPPDESHLLEQWSFENKSAMVAEGKKIEHRGFYNGQFPYTTHEEFMASLPYAEINPFQGKRY